MVFKVTFNNISAISWRSVLLMEPTDLQQDTDNLFELETLVVIDIDCTGSCKSNYHTTTTASVLTRNKRLKGVKKGVSIYMPGLNYLLFN